MARTIAYWGEPELQVEETSNDSDKTIDVPAGEVWRISWIHVELSSTATVGDRQLQVEARDASDDVVLLIRAGAVQAASLGYNYTFAPGLPRETTVSTVTLLVSLPNDVILPGGYDIRIYDVTAVDAAADDMVIQMMVEKRPYT